MCGRPSEVHTLDVLSGVKMREYSVPKLLAELSENLAKSNEQLGGEHGTASCDMNTVYVLPEYCYTCQCTQKSSMHP